MKKIKNFLKKSSLSVDTFFRRVYIHYHRRNSELHNSKTKQSDDKLFDKSGKETIDDTVRNDCNKYIAYM